METKIIFPGVLSAELVVRAMWEEALRLVTSLLAEKCLLWLLLETGCLSVHVLQGCLIDKSLPLRLCIKQDRNPEDVDDYNGIPLDNAGTVKDDDIHKEGYNDDHGNGVEEHYMSGGEGSDEGDQDFEDDFGSYSDGGSDDNDEGDEDDDDDDGDDDDDDDIDMEDYDDDDEEEETDDEDEETDDEDEDTSREDDRSSFGDSTDNNNRYPRLKNARDVYTSEDTFCLFEHECKKTRTLDIDVKSDMDLSNRGLEITYEVGKSWQFERRYTVTVLPMDGIVECSCKYFELSGVLCSHAQVALKCLGIDKIPDRYRLQKDKNLPPGPAEGVHRLIKNQEEYLQSSPHCTDSKRPAGCGHDIVSGSQADEEMRTDYTDPPLLRHAREVYSLNVFNMFQEEYKKSEYLIAREVNTIVEGGLVVHYDVEKTGKYSYFSISRHSVRAVPEDGTVNCNCKKFEKTELLCCHAIVVLDYLCIVKIPGQYILDKFKKDETVSTEQEIHGPEYLNVKSFLLYKAMNKKFNELVGMINTEEDARLLEARLDKLHELLKGMKHRLESEEFGGDSLLASGESTSATTQERTEKENTGSHNDLQAESGSTLQVIGKVDQSTFTTNSAPSCSSPQTNFGTQGDAADN